MKIKSIQIRALKKCAGDQSDIETCFRNIFDTTFCLRDGHNVLTWRICTQGTIRWIVRYIIFNPCILHAQHVFFYFKQAQAVPKARCIDIIGILIKVGNDFHWDMPVFAYTKTSTLPLPFYRHQKLGLSGSHSAFLGLRTWRPVSWTFTLTWQFLVWRTWF